MPTYCSSDARKVIEHLRAKTDSRYNPLPYDVELAVYQFYPNHINGVIDKIITPSTIEKAMKADVWKYVSKPIYSMLKARSAAHRESYEPIEFGPRHQGIVRTIQGDLCLADYNMTEQKLLLKDIPEMAEAMGLDIEWSIKACRAQGKRSIYYLHGVIKREFQTREGRLHEIQQAAQADSARAWTPPEDFEPLDLGERLEFQVDWASRRAEVNFNKRLRDQTQ